MGHAAQAYWRCRLRWSSKATAATSSASTSPIIQARSMPPTHDETADYEVDEPRRGSWVLRIAGAIVVAVGLGYGLAQGYKMILGSPSDATPS